MNKEEICRFICQELPKNHLQSILEAINAGCASSHSQLKVYNHVPLSGPGPQYHHYNVQEALLRLKGDDQFSVANSSTSPAGGNFAVLRSGSLDITASIVTQGRGAGIRNAKFRESLRKVNRWVDKQQIQDDFFSPNIYPLGPNRKSLYALILPVVANWNSLDHQSPIGVVLAVPYSNNQSKFHLWEDVSQLWQYYDIANDAVDDIAFPTIRKGLLDAESEDET